MDHREENEIAPFPLKKIYFCFTEYTKAFYCVDHNKLWKIPPPVSWEACMQDNKQQLHETMDWFQIGKVVCQGCILSPWLFNLYEEYILKNVRLDEAEAGIKISGRNINNLRYADDTTLTAEGEEELKSLLMKVKEESGKLF